jgi:hypothetical protein
MTDVTRNEVNFQLLLIATVRPFKPVSGATVGWLDKIHHDGSRSRPHFLGSFRNCDEWSATMLHFLWVGVAG